MPPSEQRIYAPLGASGGRLLVLGGVAVVLEGNEQPGWEQHREEQLRARLRLSYAERLRWLEDAKRFVKAALDAARERKRNP